MFTGSNNDNNSQPKRPLSKAEKKINSVCKYIAIGLIIIGMVGLILLTALRTAAGVAVGEGFLISAALALPILLAIYISLSSKASIKADEAYNGDCVSKEQNCTSDLENVLDELKPTISILSEKYYIPVYNYALERHSPDQYSKSYVLFWDNYFSDAGNDFDLLDDSVTNKGSHCPHFIMRDDLYPPTRLVGKLFTTKKSSHRQEDKTKLLINSLKQCLTENNEVADKSKINVVIYFIIRNGIVRYYNDIYLQEFNYPDIETLCNKYVSEHNFDIDFLSELYFYFYAQTHDIFVPLGKLRKSIFADIQSCYQNIKISKNIQTMFTKKQRNDFIETDNEKKLDEIYTDSDDSTVKVVGQTAIDIEEATLTPIQKIDKMSGRQFEEYLADFFKQQGYKTTLTPLSGDYGIDLIIENDFMKIGVQAKCYSDKVSNSAVQEAVTAIRHYNLDKVMVITNSYFQRSAIELAKDNNVMLWDRNRLIKELEKANES